MAEETRPMGVFIVYSKKKNSHTNIHETYSWYVHPKDYQSYDDFHLVRAFDLMEAEEIAIKMCNDMKIKFVECKRIGGTYVRVAQTTWRNHIRIG